MPSSPLFPYTLVRCEKEPFVLLRAHTDFTCDLTVLRTILARTRMFFNFYPEWPRFSGYARPALKEDGSNPLFYVQLWEGGEVIRSWVYRGLGYVGLLNVEVREDHKGPAHYQDYIHYAHEGIAGDRVLMDETHHRSLAMVEGDRVLIPVRWKP